jgi:hypothetical protein
MHDASSNPETNSPSNNLSLSSSVISLDGVEVEFVNEILLEPVDFVENITMKLVNSGKIENISLF